MREEFKAFYNATDDELQEIWNSENTLFVFDTNVLLNLYGYAENTRNDFFKILDRLIEKLWIPYHVGIEYQRRRLDIIKSEKNTFSEIEKNLERIQSTFKKDFEKLALKRRFPKLFDSTERLESEIKRSITNYKKSVTRWNTNQPDVRSEDKIREKINTFFEGKVGIKPKDQEWLNAIFDDGISRFDKKIPPGFGDENKSQDPKEASFIFNGLNYERQYGDLIIWKQLIEKAKEKDIHNIVFITDDAKPDWWQIVSSNGNKTIGALPELTAEIYRESNIEKFHMYSTSSFMEDGEKLLKIHLDERSIKDAAAQKLIFNSGNSFDKRIIEQLHLQAFNNKPKIDHSEISSLLGHKTNDTDESKKLLKFNSMKIRLTENKIQNLKASLGKNQDTNQELEILKKIEILENIVFDTSNESSEIQLEILNKKREDRFLASLNSDNDFLLDLLDKKKK